MGKIVSLSFFLTIVALTQACATLSKKDCLGGDWRLIGFRDGSRGYTVDRWNDNVKACSKYGVRFNKAAYLRGRESGIVQYCMPQSGFREGKLGNYYHDVCPSDLEPAFLRSYRIGSEIHRLYERVASLEADIDRYEKQLKDEKHGDKERAQIRRSIRDKEREIERLKDKADRLETEGVRY